MDCCVSLRKKTFFRERWMAVFGTLIPNNRICCFLILVALKLECHYVIHWSIRHPFCQHWRWHRLCYAMRRAARWAVSQLYPAGRKWFKFANACLPCIVSPTNSKISAVLSHGFHPRVPSAANEFQCLPIAPDLCIAAWHSQNSGSSLMLSTALRWLFTIKTIFLLCIFWWTINHCHRNLFNHAVTKQ